MRHLNLSFGDLCNVNVVSLFVFTEFAEIFLLFACNSYCHWVQLQLGERTGLVVRASDSESGDSGSILGRVGVLFP